MEKKTIGGFISAMRRANGMTQKDLADRLNVSDKTVSRWECDESAPDLSLIPVIAEIFGVSCDELLRGERRSPAEPAEAAPSPKAEKQRQRILKYALSQYRSRTYIAMGISVAGLIAALICNLAFLRAVLGFLVGAVFFAAGIVCQAVFLNRAFFSVDEEEFAEMSALNNFKRTAIRLTELSFALSACLIGFTLPLLLPDAYMGLSAQDMFLYGLICAAVLLAAYALVCRFVNVRLLNRGVYTLSEKEEQNYRRNYRLQRNCATVLAALLAVTFIAHNLTTSIWGPYSIMEGTEFHDYESFIAFMEQDLPYVDYASRHSASVETAVMPTPNSTVTYYDANGNEITEEESRRRTLRDKDGNVLCEYIARNETVCSVRYAERDGSILPITVCTYDDLDEARRVVNMRNGIFTAAYVVEAVATVLVYLRRRAK